MASKPVVVDLWRKSGPVCKVSVAWIGKRVLIVFGDNHQEHKALLEDGVRYITRGARRKKGGLYKPAGGNSIAGMGRAYFVGQSSGLGDIPGNLKEVVMQGFMQLYPDKV